MNMGTATPRRLKHRRALIAGEIKSLISQIKRKRHQLEVLDATLQIFDPAYDGKRGQDEALPARPAVQGTRIPQKGRPAVTVVTARMEAT